MTISSIGSSNYYTAQMMSMNHRSMSGTMANKAGMGKGPDPEEIFNKLDANASSGLDQTEFSTLAEKISQATGEEVDVDELFAAYDEDGDGELSAAETQSVMEDHRPEGPQGPPPPPPGGMNGGMPGDVSQFFTDMDEDESGGIDETEAETLAELISNGADESIDVETLFATYDEDEDGILNESEVQNAMEANRPQGPPPPPPPPADAENGISASLSNIENYIKMAAMGQNSQMQMLSGTSQSNALSFSTDLFQSIDTRI